MEEVEDEGDVLEEGADALLEGAFAIGDDYPGVVLGGVAAGHLGLDVGDEGVLAGQQAGPDPLVGGALARRAGLGGLGGVGEEALHHGFGGPHQGRLGEHGADRRHALLVSLLALAQPHGAGGPFGLDHGNALAVYGADQDLAVPNSDLGGGPGGVEGVEVGGGFEHELLGAALGDGDAGGVGHQGDGLVEGPADRSPDKSAADLIAVGPGRQLQFGVEGVDAVVARGAVTHTGDRHLPEQGEQATGVGPAVAQPHRAAGAGQHDRRPDVAVAPAVEVGLEQRPHDLPAPLLGPPLDLGHPEALRGGGRQEALQVPERLQPRCPLRPASRHSAHERSV